MRCIFPSLGKSIRAGDRPCACQGVKLTNIQTLTRVLLSSHFAILEGVVGDVPGGKVSDQARLVATTLSHASPEPDTEVLVLMSASFNA